MIDNWDQLQEKFHNQTESEKEEMMDFFNCRINSLGDVLFGDEANPDDFKTLVKDLPSEEDQKEFLDSVRSALLIDYE